MKIFKHLFTALLLLFSVAVDAHDFEVNGIYYNITDATNKTVAVTYKGSSYYEYSEYIGSVVIPESVTYNGNTYSVISIENYAFAGCTALTSAVIPNGVTCIKENAFRGCSSLESIEIPNSVTDIGSGAFYGCSGLENIVVENGNNVYDSRDNCNAIIETSTNALIIGCNKTVIPNGVTCIKENAFRGCSGLESIEIPNSVVSIGESAFRDCSGLASIEFPNSVTVIYHSAFRDCSGLISVLIGNSVTSIESWTFSGCSGLTSVVIGNSVTSIGNYAFNGCSGLTSIEIPNSVTSIGESAFRDCSGLTSVEILGCVTNIGDSAFAGTAWYDQADGVMYAGKVLYKYKGEMPKNTSIIIKDGTLSITDSAFSGCSGLTSIIIPNSVTSIGESAFSGCSGLTSIEIPNSVTSIGNGAFEECTGLTAVHISDISAWCNIDYIGRGYYANPLYYSKHLYLNGELVTKLVIPDGVTEIKRYTFDGCSGLASVEIPNSVTSIGESAFSDCSGLTSVVIGNSVTSIGNGAFYNCSGLTSIEIPNSVTSIGNGAFKECTGLTAVHISDISAWCNIDYIGLGYYANPLYYSKHLYLNGELVTKLVIPDGVTEIKRYTFDGCSGLASVEIPNSVTSIGESAFSDCSGLKSIEIPNSVRYIGNYAFSDCSGLKSIKIPNSVTSIGTAAFERCTGLTAVHISDLSAWCNIDFRDSYSNPLYYAKNLYLNGKIVTELVIPDDVTEIKKSAFYNCSALKSVEIHNSVTSIGNYAFYNCSGLTSIMSLIPAENLFAIDAFSGVGKEACILYVPGGAKNTYASTTGWRNFTNVAEVEPIIINEYGSVTYCSKYVLDFSNVEGLKAYAAAGYKTNSQVVTLLRVQSAVAGTGLFLKGEPGKYIVPVVENTDEHYMNMLVGTLEQTTVNGTSSDGVYANYKYAINEGEEVPLFYRFEDASTLAAGKAYLQIPLAWLPSIASKSISIKFDEGESTDIDEVEDVIGENGIYDLQGCRLSEITESGIYIINGRKVVK